MEDKLYKIILENLEVVQVKDGGGESSAIAVFGTTINESYNEDDLKLQAKYFTETILRELKAQP